MIKTAAPGLVFENAEWTFRSLEDAHDAIAEIAADDLGLNIYTNQIEIISTEQMLDAYSSIGLPLMYNHWSFGKHFMRNETMYRKGMTGLAYEIVINSEPCISYIMEENSMTMQTLVMAHAAFGHNHFFKNNYLFQQWTDAQGILDYMAFAKNYITKCEERYGAEDVETVLDAAHALMDNGVFRYRRPPRRSAVEELERIHAREQYEESQISVLWQAESLTQKTHGPDASDEEISERKLRLNLPQENILYFLEKHSPILESWQREILRIVRTLAQYLYPQRQTKVMNEGCACFVHYHIFNRLLETGRITDGAYLEMLHSHTGVIGQPDFDDPRFNGINPYALGFGMMQDIKRICIDPTNEDREWFPDFAGNKDWRGVLKDAWANYRDESFIQQFLSPHLIRKLRLFVITDDEDNIQLRVTHIHDETGYRELRRALGESYAITHQVPDIEVIDTDLKGDRTLHLRHNVINGIAMVPQSRDAVLHHIKRLWGYEVELTGRSKTENEQIYMVSTKQKKAAEETEGK